VEHLIGWQPVAWSGDGTHLLTNRTDNPDLLVTLPSVGIHVVEGLAFDGYQPNW